MATFFSDFVGVNADDLENHGAFNVSLINDLPLFIDPFLLFNSEKPEYQALHQSVLKYMRFLRDSVIDGRVTADLEKAWFMFPEVRQNWLGFSLAGNGGTGLGKDFAQALRTNMRTLFADFGGRPSPAVAISRRFASLGMASAETTSATSQQILFWNSCVPTRKSSP
jgi:hypothetical protein